VELPDLYYKQLDRLIAHKRRARTLPNGTILPQKSATVKTIVGVVDHLKASCQLAYSLRHILDDFSIKQFSVRFFAPLNTIFTPCAPLLKEKRCSLFFGLFQNGAHPFLSRIRDKSSKPSVYLATPIACKRRAMVSA